MGTTTNYRGNIHCERREPGRRQQSLTMVLGSQSLSCYISTGVTGMRNALGQNGILQQRSYGTLLPM